jgi:hypothetical protein
MLKRDARQTDKMKREKEWKKADDSLEREMGWKESFSRSAINNSECFR